MPKLSSIQNAEKVEPVEVNFGDGEVLHLKVYPNRFTQRRQIALEQLDDESDTYYEDFADLYFEVLKEWDLTDDGGKVLPFDADTVELLSTPTMLRIGEAVGESINPKSRKTSKRRSGR